MHRFHHWRVRIQDANSERAIAQVMADYRAMLSPSMVGSLPSACQDALRDTNLARAALALLGCEMRFTGDAEVGALLHEVAHTYAAASFRATELRDAK